MNLSKKYKKSLSLSLSLMSDPSLPENVTVSGLAVDSLNKMAMEVKEVEDSNDAVESKTEHPYCWEESARETEGGVAEFALTDAPEIDWKVM